MTTTQQLLYQEIETLPDHLVTEVLDFVQFLKSGWTEEAFLWSQVEQTYEYRRQHPEEVYTVTAERMTGETCQANFRDERPTSH